MYKKIILLIATPLLLSAGSLALTQGEIKAHTEIFGDSNINPATKIVQVEATMDEAITSLKGQFTIKAADLKSDNSDRDEHMRETLEVNDYPFITVDIQNITQVGDLYKLDGTVLLHGVTKPISTMATITKTDSISITGSFAIKLTDHGVKPPTLLFLSVRDRIDITYDLELK
jgi:polyisoprenoid-binding protein YceI